MVGHGCFFPRYFQFTIHSNLPIKRYEIYAADEVPLHEFKIEGKTCIFQSPAYWKA
jgi:hypothetical protein